MARTSTLGKTEIRPMRAEDVPGAEEVWSDAFVEMRTRFHLPITERSPETIESTRQRIAHLLSHDPEGAWVAIDRAERVVGLSQALVRDDLWVLSLLGVSPRHQDNGVGKALLEAALGHGGQTRHGLILCSRDPRAARRYLRAGFDLHPATTAWGVVDRSRLPGSGAVRDGGPSDTELAAGLDRKIRGGAHGPDIQQLMAEGCRLLVVPDRGYVVVRKAKPVCLAALDEEAATHLLVAALAGADDEVVEVNWITATQQWALRLVVAVGLELHPVGPVMIRGSHGFSGAYLPSGAYG